MKVKVVRCDMREGERKDGTPYIGTSAVVIFQDGKTAAQVFLSEEVIDPAKVRVGGIYDMYRDEKGFALVFDEVPPPPVN